MAGFNIYRELAIYRTLVIRQHEASERLFSAHEGEEENGAKRGDSWQAEVESLVFCAIDNLMRNRGDLICNAFDDASDVPPNAPGHGAGAKETSDGK